MSVMYSVSGSVVSPSPRRAWIEIYGLRSFTFFVIVALPTEGVD